MKTKFQIPESFEIPRQYDSHTHWQYTGEVASLPDLRGLKSAAQIGEVNFPEKLRRGEWIYAFGWDHTHWQGVWPDRKILDLFFPDTPVFLSRTDGHSSWLNTCALKKLNLWKSQAEYQQETNWASLEKQIRFEQGWPNGILHEDVHMNALFSLPHWSREQIKQQMLLGQEIYLRAGFTHIRDMTTPEMVLEVARELEKSNELKLYVEANIVAENAKDLERATKLCLEQIQLNSNRIRVKGLKIFIDGSLGSDTAYASYAASAAQGTYEQQTKGTLLWTPEEIQQAIRLAWQNKLEISVHAIGDLAADILIDQARLVSGKGLGGRLNLEHAQVLQQKTITKMKALHVRAHMQPCHYLSDQAWLLQKLGVNFSRCFPWAELSKAKVPISFGSDSPIEPSSLINNLKAILEAEKRGILPPEGDILQLHSHPNADWGAHCKSYWKDHVLQRVELG